MRSGRTTSRCSSPTGRAPRWTPCSAVGTERSPDVRFTSDDGVEHTVWLLPPSENAAIDAALSELDGLYIADGHHRSAAAARVQALRRSRGRVGERRTGSSRSSSPHEALQILPYNRLVKELGPGASARCWRVCARGSRSCPLPVRSRRARTGSGCTWTGGGDAGARPETIPRDPQARSTCPSSGRGARAAPRHPRPAARSAHRVRGRHPRHRRAAARVDRGEARAAFALWPTSMRELLEIQRRRADHASQVDLVRAEAPLRALPPPVLTEPLAGAAFSIARHRLAMAPSQQCHTYRSWTIPERRCEPLQPESVPTGAGGEEADARPQHHRDESHHQRVEAAGGEEARHHLAPIGVDLARAGPPSPASTLAGSPARKCSLKRGVRGLRVNTATRLSGKGHASKPSTVS